MMVMTLKANFEASGLCGPFSWAPPPAASIRPNSVLTSKSMPPTRFQGSSGLLMRLSSVNRSLRSSRDMALNRPLATSGLFARVGSSGARSVSQRRGREPSPAPTGLPTLLRAISVSHAAGNMPCRSRVVSS